jgi:hypothetical protein
VTNRGGHLVPEKEADGTYKVTQQDTISPAPRFFPEFTLASPKLKVPMAYPDKIIPVAVRAIQQREDPNRTLLNSVEISQAAIPLSTDKVDNSVWGVATWDDIDPKTDVLSIYIKGLTNAYRWVDKPAVFKVGDPPLTGRSFTQRRLKLNFWRPGDEFDEHEKEIRYGIPGEVDYEWVWR